LIRKTIALVSTFGKGVALASNVITPSMQNFTEIHFHKFFANCNYSAIFYLKIAKKDLTWFFIKKVKMQWSPEVFAYRA